MLPLMQPRVLCKDPRYSIGYLEDCDMLVIKTFVLVPMALKPRAQHVPPMVLIFVRLVPVDITKPTASVTRVNMVNFNLLRHTKVLRARHGPYVTVLIYRAPTRPIHPVLP